MEQDYAFQLLAPPSGLTFGRPEVNDDLYTRNLAAVQKLRGKVYFESGAVDFEELEPDGRFAMAGDEQSWHLLLIDDKQAVVGCARYRIQPSATTFEQLLISGSGFAVTLASDQRGRCALEHELQIARAHKLSYVEMGGWALATTWRGTRAALETLLACYALGALWGGSLMLSMASVRHRSSSVLRRIGGSSLNLSGVVLSACSNTRDSSWIELLRFDSRSPAPQFFPVVNKLFRKLSTAVVLQAGSSQGTDASCNLAFRASNV